jgi:hypothetical protein
MQYHHEPNPQELNKYFKYYSSIVNAKKRYTEKNKNIINEKARDKYNEDTEYKERKLLQMREYARKRREEAKLKKEEEIKKDLKV